MLLSHGELLLNQSDSLVILSFISHLPKQNPSTSTKYDDTINIPSVGILQFIIFFFFKYSHTVDIVWFFPLIIAEVTNNMRLGIAIQYFLIAILYLVVHRVVDLRNHWYW